MPNGLDALLKTDQQSTGTAPKSDDIFKYPKLKIKNICKALCLPSNTYDPQKTVESIKSLLNEQSTKNRILYSEITSFVYGLSSDDQGIFATNIENLLSFSENATIDDQIKKVIVKIYDHCQLAFQQKNLNARAYDMLIEASDEATKRITKTVIDKTQVDTKKIEKEYITILGIFSSVVLSFVGGLAFSSSILQNINAVSVYRLLAVIDLLAFVLINTIYILVKFICQINDKDIKLFKLWPINLFLAIFGVSVVLAWAIDAKALLTFISQWIPWLP